MRTVLKKYTMTCDECGLSSHDQALMEHHSCDIQQNGGRCEDYPACGHEWGDCNGLLYGSDEAIKEQVEIEWRTGHGYCEHSAGIYNCEPDWDDDEVDDDE